MSEEPKRRKKSKRLDSCLWIVVILLGVFLFNLFFLHFLRGQ